MDIETSDGLGDVAESHTIHFNLHSEMEVRVRMVELRSRRLVEDITQVRFPPRRAVNFKSGSLLECPYVPNRKTTRAYRRYRLNDGRTVKVKTLSEMSL